MKRAYWLIAALPLALAGCAAEEPPETDVAETGMADPTQSEQPMGRGMGAMASTVSMSPLGNSQASGEAILTPSGDQTEVSVSLNGLEPDGTHPGHIHQGTCQSVGSVVVPLSEITADASGSGTMTTTAAIQADSAMAGNHVVVYHGTGGTPIVCGEIEEHVM